MKYALIVGDRFDADRESLYFSHLGRDPEYAELWNVGLSRAVAGLTEFPGPGAYQVDDTASALYGREVRRLLYYGPTRRRSGTPARILYAILPPSQNMLEDDEAGVLLLRLLHGSQTLLLDEDG